MLAVAAGVVVVGVLITMLVSGPLGRSLPAEASSPMSGPTGVGQLVPLPAPPVPAAPVVAPLTPADRARCPARSVACVDLATHAAWLQRGDAVVFGPVPILPGTETGLLPPGPTSSATPIGTFHVLRKKANEFSEEFHEPMPEAVYFAPRGIAFHQGSLTESSNGCVHLDALAARAFFQGLRVGDGVTVF